MLTNRNDSFCSNVPAYMGLLLEPSPKTTFASCPDALCLETPFLEEILICTNKQQVLDLRVLWYKRQGHEDTAFVLLFEQLD